jgi:adenylate cyclase
MNTKLKTFIILAALAFCPVLLSAQADLQTQVEVANKLIEQKNYKQAIIVAREAYRNSVQAGDLNRMVLARILEAQALHGDSPYLSKKKLANEVEQRLQDAYRIASGSGRDSLIALIALQSENLLGKVLIPPTPPSPPGGGGVTSTRPRIPDLTIESAVEPKNQRDQLGHQYAALKLEKEQLEKQYRSEIEQLSLEQTQQQLLLALQQQALDSISMTRLQDSLLVTQAKEELQRQESELERQRSRMILLTVTSLSVLLIAAGLLWLYFNTRRKNRIIEQERQRSEELLLNILPLAVAEELKANGKASARHYDQATVLFTDFKNFSLTASKLRPEELVDALDRCFRAFDEIAGRHGLEKIKTIGDAYMCAGGLPKPDPEHPRRAVQAALEMQAWLQAAGTPFQGARIGLHTGPVVAGVVGAKKFAYDIWGDTVNVAARVESKGEIGRVNLSKATYDLVKDAFQCTHRGKVPAKNMGEVDMYFVEKQLA